MFIIRCLILYLFLWVQTADAQDYTQFDSFPGEPRDDAIAELIEGNIYYGTGFSGFFQPLNDFWRYSLEDRSWEQLPNAPFSPRQYCASAAVDRYLFVIAGWNSPTEFYDEVWRLNVQSGNWQRMSDFPGEPRWGAVAVENAGRVYFGTGRDSVQRFNDWWRYDLENDQWTQLQNLPATGRNVAIAELIDNEVLAGFGEDSAGNPLDDLWVYDIAHNTWQEMKIPGLPALKHPASAVLHDKLFLAGGENADSLTTRLLQIDPQNNEMTDYGAGKFEQGRGGNLLSDACSLYLLGGLSPNFERLNDFVEIEFPAFDAERPEVFPNPAAEEISVKHPPEARKIQIFNMKQKLVREVDACCDQTTINLSGLQSGMYLVRWCGNGCSETVKFVVVPGF